MLKEETKLAISLYKFCIETGIPLVEHFTMYSFIIICDFPIPESNQFCSSFTCMGLSALSLIADSSMVLKSRGKEDSTGSQGLAIVFAYFHF